MTRSAPPCSSFAPASSSTLWLTSSSVTGGYLLRSEEHTSELQSPYDLVCRLLLEKKKRTARLADSGVTYTRTHPARHPRRRDIAGQRLIREHHRTIQCPSTRGTERLLYLSRSRVH